MTRTDIENLSSESMEDLDTLIEDLNYQNIESMLQDNPGMVEAIYEFVLDHSNVYGIEDT